MRIRKRNDEYWRRIAGEYVLGTLRGRARRRFERLRARDAYYCNMADEWEGRFQPLADSLPDTEPPPEVWARISKQLDASGNANGLWNRLSFWRGFGLAAAGLAACLLVFVAVGQFAGSPDGTPERVAILTDKNKAATWLITIAGSGRQLTVAVLKPVTIPEDRTLELWIITKPGEAPHSLGLMVRAGRRTIELSADTARLWQRARLLAITLEPSGGWKPGTKLGPLLFSGPLGSLPE